MRFTFGDSRLTKKKRAGSCLYAKGKENVTVGAGRGKVAGKTGV